MTDQPKTFSAKQIARRIGTDAKTFRKWCRSDNSPYIAVGQGSRYEFPASELEEIQQLFIEWQESKNGNGHAPS